MGQDIKTKVSDKLKSLSDSEFMKQFLPYATIGWDSFSKVFAVNYGQILGYSKNNENDAIKDAREKITRAFVDSDRSLFSFLYWIDLYKTQECFTQETKTYYTEPGCGNDVILDHIGLYKKQKNRTWKRLFCFPKTEKEKFEKEVIKRIFDIELE